MTQIARIIARLLRRFADWLHKEQPRDERGRFQFQSGVDGACVNRVWVDGQPFVREPKHAPQKRTPKARAK